MILPLSIDRFNMSIELQNLRLHSEGSKNISVAKVELQKCLKLRESFEAGIKKDKHKWSM